MDDKGNEGLKRKRITAVRWYNFERLPHKNFLFVWRANDWSSVIDWRSLSVRDVPWLKKPSKEPMSHIEICMWFLDGSKFEPFRFSSGQNIDHVFFPEMAHFLTRKSWKFEAKVNSKYWMKKHVIIISSRNLTKTKRFEFWTISKSHAYSHMWHWFLRWLFELSHDIPRTNVNQGQKFWLRISPVVSLTDSSMSHAAWPLFRRLNSMTQ